ncbi:Flp pilus assembly protein CpaB [Tepidanaerobacter acetatoxydans]|uniref:Flp pilus assembly protein CpaB n=1 Tax=Tepidanaerobacter acetatoxydans TaxID=499229 RepID=UPI001BD36067|nr:Flp pilus assembly protein CpaB [Tepidanaerobacter acetatoxydans]
MFFKKKKLILIILSLLLAAGITFAEYTYFSGMAKKEPTVKVVVANANIPAGAKIDGMGAEKAIPESIYVKDMISTDKPVSGFAKVDISKGTYILQSMVSGTQVPVIRNGMRRVTIGVDLVAALAGRIKAGDFVDVGYIPKKEAEERGGDPSAVIAKSVQIYNIVNKSAADTDKKSDKDNQYDSDSIIPAAVTIIVTPEQAVKIKDMENRGSLFLLGY